MSDSKALLHRQHQIHCSSFTLKTTRTEKSTHLLAHVVMYCDVDVIGGITQSGCDHSQMH